ncbi:hypothetical protein TNIN_466961 [Trichonephila inaurata madagascariensis]|uniref:Uncharacterized protein n=1 Tax=Trichonephila inaurata madagascariensis TaxID=2747483 RepID=A0A8X6INM8_9ARAC|nr:hypothetical protein TNIN_466961 [Trichonephila inaurata madagascariensis]
MVSDKSVENGCRFLAGRKSGGDDRDQASKHCHHERSPSTRWTTIEETPKRKRFNSGRRAQGTVKAWVSSKPQEFWEQGILRLVHRGCCSGYGCIF